MTATRFHALFILSLLAFAASAAEPTNPDRAAQLSHQDAAERAVRAALDHYLKGHATGDASHMRKAFLPTANIEGIRDGTFTSWTLEEYCARFNGHPASDEAKRVRSIDVIDVSGDSAMAKATLDHVDTVFTDYFVLLNTGGEWRIANKVYYGRKRQSTPSR